MHLLKAKQCVARHVGCEGKTDKTRREKKKEQNSREVSRKKGMIESPRPNLISIPRPGLTRRRDST
jgi:hypothetical protein